MVSVRFFFKNHEEHEGHEERTFKLLLFVSFVVNFIKYKFLYYRFKIFDLKIASVLWLNMQGIGHAAIVNYCNCPITQQIRPQGAPEGFACFEFFLTHLFDEII